MNFIAIDFETANSNRNSACEIGLVKVVNSKIIEEKSFLIKPNPNEFDYFNTLVHGINENDVKNSPNFEEVYVSLKNDFEEFPIIAHNASFDISVLRHSLNQFGITFPTTKYSCTYQMSRQHFTDFISHKLNEIAMKLDIPLEHHRALSDAKACALIALKIFEEKEIKNFEEIESKFKLKLGKLFKDGYKPSSIRGDSSNYKISDLKFEENHNADSLFFQKNVVFTGTLESMIRKEAQIKILKIGGQCQSTVTKDTNFLVLGEQDFNKFGEGYKSSKIKKAEKLKLKGSDIEIISESQFLELINE